MNLPTSPINNLHDNPKFIILYGMPKVGKTEAIARLDNCLIIDLDREIDYIRDAKAHGIKVKSLIELMQLGEELKKKKRPYKYISIDNLTVLEEWAEQLALQYYKRSSLGSSFTGTTVMDLSHGAGYYWIRKAFGDLIKTIGEWAEVIILVGHVKEKIVGSQPGDKVAKSGIEISTIDLELTGKLGKITMAKADSIGYVYRKTIGVNKGEAVTEAWVSFKASGELVAGSRVFHLKGRDLFFSRKLEDNTIETNWENIFLEDKKL